VGIEVGSRLDVKVPEEEDQIVGEEFWREWQHLEVEGGRRT
jgi:hypothetical protein